MIQKTDINSMKHLIAKRVAKELNGSLTVNLGIGIPTLVAQYMKVVT